MTVYFVNEDGNLISSVPIDLGGAPEAYSIQGFVQFADSGLGAALFTDDSLLIFNNQSGGIKAVNGFDPVGLVRWDGELYVTGLQAGSPVVARLDANGSVGSPRPGRPPRPPQARSQARQCARRAQQPLPHRQLARVPLRYRQLALPLGPPARRLHHRLHRLAGRGPGLLRHHRAVTAVAFAPVGFAIP